MANEIIEREEARARGLMTYFTGRPCGRGMAAPRRVSSKQCTCELCLQAQSKSARNWQKANPERNRENFNRWRAENSRAIESAKHRARHPEKIASAKRASIAKNPGIYRAMNSKRKAAERTAIPAWYGEWDEFVMQEAAALCLLRIESTGIDWHIDHLIPLQARTASGLHCAANIQVIPAFLNIGKCNRMVLTEPREWLRRI